MSMRRICFRRALSLLGGFALLLSLIPAVSAASGLSPAVSDNINREDYTVWSSPVTSYLFANDSGGLTRVEYLRDAGSTIIVEDYDSSYRLQASRTIPMELSIWGGFFAGEKYNFFVFGQKNPDENDSTEVYRIVKYSKDWKRLGAAGVRGANTTVPFDAGSMRAAECGDYLYLRTCHEMYRTPDGYNHQANVTLSIRESDMTLVDSFYQVGWLESGYVSHSFNQFILVDQDNHVVCLDHGDAASRGVNFTKYNRTDASTGKFSGAQWGLWGAYGSIFDFAGREGDNITGASIGGLAETTSCYVFAYNYDGVAQNRDRDVYYHYMDKATGRSWSVKIGRKDGESVTTPVLASRGLSGGYMLWNAKKGNAPTDTLYYFAYDENAKPSGIQEGKAALSDCNPIFYQGKAVWYVTSNSAPVFYELDANGVRSTAVGESNPQDPGNPSTPSQPGTPSEPGTPGTPVPDDWDIPETPTFADVPRTHWAYPYVEHAYSRAWVFGTNAFDAPQRTFSPDRTLSGAELVTMVTRYLYSHELPYEESEPWYMDYMNLASAKGLLVNTGMEGNYQEAASRPINRYLMSVFLYNVLRAQNTLPTEAQIQQARQKIGDYASIPQTYRQAVLTCYALGVLNGTDNQGRFGGDGLMTRCQSAKIICVIADLGLVNRYFCDRTFDTGELLNSYWESRIQDNFFYRFSADGTAREYLENYSSSGTHYLYSTRNLTWSYSPQKKQLQLKWEDGQEALLDLVVPEADIDWDRGLSSQLSQIPRGQLFFYDLDWVYENAFYLTKSDMPLSTPVQ